MNSYQLLGVLIYSCSIEGEKIKTTNSLSKLITLILICIPMLMYLIFDVFFYVTFIPNVELIGVTIKYHCIYSIVMCFIICPLIKEQWAAFDFKKLFSILCMPFVFFYLSYSFISGPVFYMFHLLSPSQTITITEAVSEASGGNKYCRNKLMLSSGQNFFPIKICNASYNDVNALRFGGKIELYGTRSDYGFIVIKYRALVH